MKLGVAQTAWRRARTACGLVSRRMLLLTSLGVVVAPILGISAAPAQANSTFQLVNFNTYLLVYPHRCLGINSSSDAGNWTCTTGNDQLWHWGNQLGNTGYYQLINNNNQCLGVAGGSTADGARIVGWTCNGHHDQYWNLSTSVDYNGVVFFAYINANSGKVIGVSGESTANGAPVIQWHYNGHNDQFWNENFQ